MKNVIYFKRVMLIFCFGISFLINGCDSKEEDYITSVNNQNENDTVVEINANDELPIETSVEYISDEELNNRQLIQIENDNLQNNTALEYTDEKIETDSGASAYDWENSQFNNEENEMILGPNETPILDD